MQSVTPSSFQPPGLQNYFSPHCNAEASSESRVDTETKTTANLTIVTAEGDKVTLSAASALRGTYATYNAQGHLQGQGQYEVQTEGLSLSSHQGFGISIEGDLSDEELADIEQLLVSIKKIAGDFLEGDVEGALAQTLDISGLDSIAMFNAFLRYEERVALSHRYEVSHAAEAAPPEALQSTNAQEHADADDTDHAVDQIMQTVHDSRLASSRLATRIPELVASIFERLTEAQELDTSQRKIATSISAKLSQRFQFTAFMRRPTTGTPASEEVGV